MHIFHIAEAARWEAAQLAGSYAQSTLGRTLDDEGFIHAAREDQWADVRRRHYADTREPLVLLVIDTEKLTSPWQEDVVGDTTYPHIYGPINPAAVVTAVPLSDPAAPAVPVAAARPRSGPQRTLFQEFLVEASFRMAAAIAVMAFAVVCAVVGSAWQGNAGALVGILLGLVVGGLAVVPLARRRDQRLART